jgi:hypothetical protein
MGGGRRREDFEKKRFTSLRLRLVCGSAFVVPRWLRTRQARTGESGPCGPCCNQHPNSPIRTSAPSSECHITISISSKPFPNAGHQRPNLQIVDPEFEGMTRTYNSWTRNSLELRGSVICPAPSLPFQVCCLFHLQAHGFGHCPNSSRPGSL